MKSFIRSVSLALVILFGPWAFFAIRAQEMTYLNWFLLGLPFVWLALFGIWFLIFGKGSVRRRFFLVGATATCIMAAGFGLSRMLRYEGSASGSSFPKFSWKWNDPSSAAGTKKAFISSQLSGEEARLMAAMGDSTDFLGPQRNGVFPAPSFATDWDAHPPELLWRRPLGKAWSGFTVKGRFAITQEQADHAERILCLDLLTGEERWHYDNENTRLLLVKEENAGAAMGGDGPRATPVIHNQRVYALGATGILNCLDLATGSEIWTRNIIRDFGGEVQRWGSANSALILDEEGLLVIPATDVPGVTLVALDLETGAERWSYEGDGASYSSPRLLTMGGEPMVVSVNREDVTAHRPNDGKLLWKYEWPGKLPKVAQPILAGENLILVTASYGVGSPLLKIAKDENGQWSATQQWKSTRMKTKFSSAVILDDHAYGIDEGRLAAIRLEDGKKAWKNLKVGFGQHLLLGDQLLIQTEQGPVIIGAITPAGFEESGRIEDALSSMTWNVPTLAGHFLIVRNDQEAACYLLKANDEAQANDGESASRG